MPRIHCALVLLALIQCTGASRAAEPPGLDNHGDPLPAGAVLRLGTTRLQAEGSFFAWTRDGKSLITMRGGTVYFWGMTDGHARETLPVPTQERWQGSQFAISGDDKSIVLASSRSGLAVWDLATSKIRVKSPEDIGKEISIGALTISPDGRVFGTYDGDQNEVGLWDAATLEIRRRVSLGPHRGYRTSLAFTPDGKLLAAASRRSIVLMPSDGSEPSEIADAAGDGIWALKFSSDGKSLLSASSSKPEKRVGADGKEYLHSEPQLRVWNVADKQMLLELPAAQNDRGWVTADLAPDDRTLVTVHRNRLQVWDLTTRKVLREMEGVSARNPNKVCIDPTGRFVALDDSSDDYVQVWSLATGQPHLTTGQHHLSTVLRAAWSPDGSLIATGDNRGSLRLWDAQTGKLVRSMTAGESGVWHLEFTPDGKRLLVGGGEHDAQSLTFGGGVRLYEVGTGELLKKYIFATHVRKLALAPDGNRLAVVAATGPPDAFAKGTQAIQLVDLAAGKITGQMSVPAGNIQALQWSAEGKSLSYVGEDAKVRRTNAETGELISEKSLYQPRLDAATGKLVPGWLGEAAFFRDGSNLISVGALPEVYHWIASNGERQWALTPPCKRIRALAVSPDERMFAAICSSGDEVAMKLVLWDVATQRQLQEIGLGIERADAIAFSPGGSRVVIGFYDGTAVVYDVSEALGKVE